MAPPENHHGYELDPDEVRHVIKNELEPEIDRLNGITAGLQYHGQAYSTWWNSGKPIPDVTEPLSSGSMVFGDPAQIVNPFSGGVLFQDSNGEAYQQGMDTLDKLFDLMFASFIGNQNALLETMRDFRQRLLASVDAYEGAETAHTATFNRIQSGDGKAGGQ
jgi:hypothetical protein